MKITHQKQTKNKKNAMGVLAAGVAGAVAVAGVAVAATIALRDDKTRAKVKKALLDVKDQALDYAQTVQKESNGETKTIKKAVKDTKKVVEKKISER